MNPFTEDAEGPASKQERFLEPFPLSKLIDTVDECIHFFSHIPNAPWPGSKLHYLNEVASVGPLTVHRSLKSSLFRGIQTLRAANGMWFSETPFKNGNEIGFRKTPTDMATLVILMRTVEMASSRVNWVILPADTATSKERAKHLMRNECTSMLEAKKHTTGLQTQSGVAIPIPFEEAVLKAQRGQFRGLERVSQSKIIKEAAESFATYLGLAGKHPPVSQDQTIYMWNLSSVIAHGQGWPVVTDVAEALEPVLVQWVEVVAQHLQIATLRLQACSTDNSS
ncbi:hypothetical protein [Corynebacterium sp. CCUG 71335]|uniref:hypothetical protein n=1 Tax=Corynebacterium sp. CCUG 71335 TaxID=2823892 RepID=UPI00210E7505|nr:hypothetical protein [Corynebacterium sp. CCUG 71335]